MDIQRMVLVLIFGMSAVFLWNEWQRFNNPPPATNSAPSAPAPTATTSGAPPATAPVSQASPAVPVPATPVASGGERITIESDLLRLVVNTTGGVIEEADLKTQQGTVDKRQPYRLLLVTKDRVHVEQAGLIGEGMPTHK